MSVAVDQSSAELRALIRILKSGHCLSCGRNDAWQEPTCELPTMIMQCTACGESFMIDLNREAWV